MVNTSATGGYLAPVGAVDADLSLEEIWQGLVTGVTGLDGRYVRPRWQEVVPKSPPIAATWCAIGTMLITADGTAAVVHSGAGDGKSQLRQHELVTVLATFYGPSAQAAALRLRDGLSIQQNRETLQKQAIALVECGEVRAIPALINENWRRSYELEISFRRLVLRDYAILNIESAAGELINDLDRPSATDANRIQPWEVER